jgi:hypothetical protein
MAKATLNLEIIKGTTFGPVQITCKDSNGTPVPLAGWSAYAEVRKDEKSALILDLAPVIAADDAAGLVTLPEIPWSTTDDLPVMVGQWDLILEDGTGRRLPPFLGGRVNIALPVTQKAT